MYTPYSTQWNVQHYGALLDDYQTEIDGRFLGKKYTSTRAVYISKHGTTELHRYLKN